MKKRTTLSHQSHRLIKRFVSMHKHARAYGTFQRLKKDIENILKKKKTPHRKELKELMGYLTKVISKLKSNDYGIIHIPKGSYKQYQAILTPSSKKPLALNGSEKEEEAFEEWNQERFRKFAKSNHTPQDLNGLPDAQSREEKPYLPPIPNAYKPESIEGKKAGVMNVNEAKSIEINGIGVKAPWLSVMGDFARDSSMQVFGKGGQGKTTFLLMFSQYFADNHGAVAYVTSEEFGRGTFKKTLNQLNIHNGAKGNIDVVSGLDQINLSDYRMVIIDSKDNIGLDINEYISLKEAHPTTFFVIVSQATKDGTFRGSKEWEHECDINLQVDNFIATTEGQKNRWGGCDSLHFDYMGKILSPQTNA